MRSPAPAHTVFLIVLLGALVPLAGVRRGALGVMLVGLGLLVIWSPAAQLAFDSGTMLDYADPLAALPHAHRLVHRDVKPANVLLTVDRPEHAYLTDFGVARHVGSAARLARVGHWVGTLAYVAPEQVRAEAVDASADIYSPTGVLYHCLTGQGPFPRESEAATLWAHVSAPPPAPSQLVPGLPGRSTM